MKYLFLTLFLLLSLLAGAQEKGCGILQAQEVFFKKDPTLRERTRLLLEAANEESQGPTAGRPQQNPFVIPVVFHILHTNGSENISDAQILDQIAILTRDFRKLNPDTLGIVSPFQNLAADCNIEFRLATLDPDGNCTNGITRHFDLNTIWTIDYDNYIYTWDRTKYLNIYVVKSLPGMAAYANYPGTVPPWADAILVESQYVGSIGTSNVGVSRVLTHEVGHWLNLQHVWGNTNNPGVTCGDDGVADTPVTRGFTWCSLNNTMYCTPNVPENIQNYMDYAYCQRMFTYGQKTRMQNALNSQLAGRNNLWTPANLLATGVTNPTFNCAPVAEYFWNTSVTCSGTPLAFYDQSYNAPVTNWQWSSPLATNVSTQQNGALTFGSSGLAEVKLKVSNAWGSDSITKPAVVVLSTQFTSGTSISQGFENVFPDNSWISTVPPTGSGFVKILNTSYNGFNCGWVDNYTNSPKRTVSFFSPRFSLQGAQSGQISFYFAYAPRTGTGTESLKVLISTNCGLNWTPLVTKTGSSLNTTGGVMDNVFVNPQFEQWQQVVTNLAPFLGNSSVHFRFDFTPDANAPGNNLYIDDINLSRTYVTGIEEDGIFGNLSVSPNPFHETVRITGDAAVSGTTLRLFDVSGRELQIKVREGENSLELDAHGGLADGIYFLEINAGASKKTIKIVKN